ncbi:phosphatase-7 [Danaus plexippus plexippus]|uniref:Serine/threonine-protein phosphatase with EF-hands n=2 Tax=Danaus plexippus TaxID=13037 RepID=A0A212EZK5_DANPL|nr:serine/threonine-protein phosphatase rdgC [Danaus plexippus plexippus]OWR46920.1 phosphatase-7 [Danaus plexippus plexippus]QDQ16916.1 retinal degeneration C [Danaus plexippus]
MFSFTEGCGCVSFRGGRRARSLGDDSSSCRSSEIEQEVPKKIGKRILNGDCTMKALAPFWKFWKKDEASMTKAERTMKAAILIQQWYRRYLARMEVRRRYTWTIFQSIEYAGEQDQVKLYNFFNALLSHMRETSGRPSSERTSRTASVMEQIFSEESDEGGGVDETAPPKNCREPDIEFPLQRKDIDLLIEAFRKKKVTQILKEASQMLKRLPNINVATTSISSQITICGDLHGKLDDLLVIFHKNGLPSPENPYIFNGDFVDRGKKGLEVLLLLLACMLTFPGGVYLNRGNHEDLIMNTRYGFIREVHQKYRHNAERLLKLIENVYRWLPLGTIINNRVFVVHGGISDTTDLDMLRSMERDKYASLLRPPLNEGAAPGAEAIDKVEWKQVFDILWSDPQSTGGCVANALRGAGTYFGPDVTSSFLNKNKLSFIIRSHECKPGGYEILHNGNVITIFSASNYYELGSNKGAYLKLCGNALDRQFVQYTAAVSRTRRLTFRQRVGLVESSAMRELHSHIMTARRTLEATFRSMDLDQSGFITISDWCYAMEETTHLGLPWRMLKDKLVRTDPDTRRVRYMDTFELLANKIGRKSDAQTVVETLYKNKRSLEAIFKILDKDNSGFITLEEFSEACQLLGKYMPNPMTQEQLVDICRLMDINKDGLVDLNEFLESFRLAEKSLHEDEHVLAEMKAS